LKCKWKNVSFIFNISSFSQLHLLLCSLSCFCLKPFSKGFSLSLLQLFFSVRRISFFCIQYFSGFICWRVSFINCKQTPLRLWEICFSFPYHFICCIQVRVSPFLWNKLQCPSSSLSWSDLRKSIFGESHFETFDHGLSDAQIDKRSAFVCKCLLNVWKKKENIYSVIHPLNRKPFFTQLIFLIFIDWGQREFLVSSKQSWLFFPKNFDKF